MHLQGTNTRNTYKHGSLCVCQCPIHYLNDDGDATSTWEHQEALLSHHQYCCNIAGHFANCILHCSGRNTVQKCL